MAKKKLPPEFRKLAGDKLMDLGNFAAVAFVFGQIVSGNKLSLPIFLAGLFLLAFCYIVGYILNK